MSLHADVLKTLRDHAIAKEIDGNRCFIVPFEVYAELYDRLGSQIGLESDDKLTRLRGLENFAYTASSKDEGEYFICCESEKVLDPLWERKHKA